MPLQRTKLQRLYIKEKLPSVKIAKVFNCSERTVNYWLARYGIKKRSISEAMYLRYNPNGDPFKVIHKPRTVKEATLYGLGLGLFWGEGNKKNKGSIRLGNTDPAIIKKFIQFLIKIFRINKKKLRFGLQVFNDMSEKKSLAFWLKELKEFGIKKNQFFKVTVTPSRSIGNYREKSRFGVLTVYFSNTKLKNILDRQIADVAQGQSNSMVN